MPFLLLGVKSEVIYSEKEAVTGRTIENSVVQYVTIEYLKCDSLNLRCAVSVKHTSDFEDLVHEKNVKYINFKILITWTSLVVQ